MGIVYEIIIIGGDTINQGEIKCMFVNSYYPIRPKIGTFEIKINYLFCVYTNFLLFF